STRGRGLGRPESAAPETEERPARTPGDRQVGNRITVQVQDADGIGSSAQGSVSSLAKRSRPIIPEDGDGVFVVVRRDQVEIPVSIEVPRRDPGRYPTDLEVERLAEAGTAEVEADGDPIVIPEVGAQRRL